MATPVAVRSSAAFAVFLLFAVHLAFFMPSLAWADFGDKCTDAAASSDEVNSTACDCPSAEECVNGVDNVDQIACIECTNTMKNLPAAFQGALGEDE